MPWTVRRCRTIFGRWTTTWRWRWIMITIVSIRKNQSDNQACRRFSNLYRSLYRSSFDDLSASPAVPLGRLSSGVELRDEWSSGVGLRLDASRPLPLLPGTGACGGKWPGWKLCTGGTPPLDTHRDMNQTPFSSKRTEENLLIPRLLWMMGHEKGLLGSTMSSSEVVRSQREVSPTFLHAWVHLVHEEKTEVHRVRVDDRTAVETPYQVEEA